MSSAFLTFIKRNELPADIYHAYSAIYCNKIAIFCNKNSIQYSKPFKL